MRAILLNSCKCGNPNCAFVKGSICKWDVNRATFPEPDYIGTLILDDHQYNDFSECRPGGGLQCALLYDRKLFKLLI